MKYILIFSSIILILSVIYLYPLLRILYWADNLSKKTVLISVLYTVIIFSLFIILREYLKGFLYYQMGFISFLFLFVLIADILWWGGLRKLILPEYYYKSILAITFIISLISIYNFYRPIEVNNFTIKSNKISKNYSFLQVTDTQFGSTDRKDLGKVLKTVNNELKNNKIDAIVFTGDAVDTYNFSIEDFKGFDFSNYPNLKKYFSTGNHDMSNGVIQNISSINDKFRV